MQIFNRTLSGIVSKIFRWAKKNKQKLGWALFGMILTIGGGLISSIPYFQELKKELGKMNSVSKKLNEIGSYFAEKMSVFSSHLNFPAFFLKNLLFLIGTLLSGFSAYSHKFLNFLIISSVTFFYSILVTVEYVQEKSENTSNSFKSIEENLENVSHRMKYGVDIIPKKDSPKTYKVTLLSYYLSYFVYGLAKSAGFFDYIFDLISKFMFNIIIILILIIIIKWRTD